MKRKVRQVVQEPIDYVILDSMGNANPWTPVVEEAWMREVRKLSGYQIYRRFPPLNKAPSVGRRATGSGWGR